MIIVNNGLGNLASIQNILRQIGLSSEISNDYENIHSFPLDVTDKLQCKKVFEQIRDKFDNIDICFFSTGTWDPKREKDIDVDQIENVFKVNFFGTLNSIKAVEEYFKNKKKGTISIVSSIVVIEDYPIQLDMVHQNLHLTILLKVYILILRDIM